MRHPLLPPQLLMELRGSLTGNDTTLAATVALPHLPWSENDREAVTLLAEEMISQLLRLRRNHERTP